jgi:hypothetical protein
MLNHAKNLVNTAVKLVGSVAGRTDSRSAAAQKAVVTRERNAKKRSDSARRAAETRKTNAAARSSAAKRGARKRTQTKARVDAMVDATKRD